MVAFSFKGRYTLREINNSWYIYDRESKNGFLKDFAGHTFTKAKETLLKYKKERGDKI